MKSSNGDCLCVNGKLEHAAAQAMHHHSCYFSSSFVYSILDSSSENVQMRFVPLSFICMLHVALAIHRDSSKKRENQTSALHDFTILIE